MALSNWMPTPLLGRQERAPIPEAKARRPMFRPIYVAAALSWLLVGNFVLRCLGKRGRQRARARTLHILQGLGTIWIRIGQTLALQSHILGEPYSEDLMELRGHGEAHPFERIQAIIEAELKRPLTEVFSHIEKEPFAAGTGAQLHRARLLKEEVEVAVKVQNPVARELFQRDLKLVGYLIGLARLFKLFPSMRWDDLYHELGQIETRELNYHYEAAALRNLAQNTKGQPIHVPEVYSDYSSERVMVMDFIRGALLKDVIRLRQTDPERVQAWLDDNNIDLDRTGKRLFHSVFRQVFRDNYFHGDMRTSNIILLQKSHLAVIDCRGYGSLEAESLSKQRMFLQELAAGELVNAAEIYFLLASRLPRVNLIQVKNEMLQIWRDWYGISHVVDSPFRRRSLTTMLGRMNRLLNRYNFGARWSFSVLTKAWVHLDTCLAHMSPRLDYLEQVRQVFRQQELSELKESMTSMPERLSGGLIALSEIPRRLEEYQLFQETLMRRQAQMVQSGSSKIEAVLSAAFSLGSLVTLLSGIYLCLVWWWPSDPATAALVLGPQLYDIANGMPEIVWPARIAVIGLMFPLYRFLRRQRHRFSQGEASIERSMRVL